METAASLSAYEPFPCAIRTSSEHVYDIPNGKINAYTVLVEMFNRSGVNQTEFARAMGVHHSTLSRYLSGREKPPRVIAAAAIFAGQCFGVAIRIKDPGKRR